MAYRRTSRRTSTRRSPARRSYGSRSRTGARRSSRTRRSTSTVRIVVEQPRAQSVVDTQVANRASQMAGTKRSHF